MTRTIVALALVGAVLGIAPGTPPAEAAGTGVYSAPTWYPLRGSSKVGCTWSNGCNGHHSYLALDLLQAKGSPVHAAGAGRLTIKGTVTACSSAAGYGTWVEVDHGGGVTTRYAHLSRITVANGAWVDQNTKIGEVGATGSVVPCTANHLHYEQRKNGTGVAPNALKGCNGTVYPSTWGYSGWNQVPAHQKTITNTGSCSTPPPPPPPSTPGWENVAGSLAQIAYGPGGEIWGVDGGGRLLQYAGLGRWTVRGQGYRHVSIGRAADAGGPNVYALTTSGAIRRTRNDTTFETIKGTLVQIDHGPDGQIWGVNAAGNLYQYAGRSTWTKRDQGFRHVTVGTPAAPGGPSVYALTDTGKVRATADGTSWQDVGGTLVQIDLGPQGELWGTNSSGRVYRRTAAGAWSVQGSGFRNVSVGVAADAGGPFVYAVIDGGLIRRRR